MRDKILMLLAVIFILSLPQMMQAAKANTPPSLLEQRVSKLESEMQRVKQVALAHGISI